MPSTTVLELGRSRVTKSGPHPDQRTPGVALLDALVTIGDATREDRDTVRPDVSPAFRAYRDLVASAKGRLFGNQRTGLLRRREGRVANMEGVDLLGADTRDPAVRELRRALKTVHEARTRAVATSADAASQRTVWARVPDLTSEQVTSLSTLRAHVQRGAATSRPHVDTMRHANGALEGSGIALKRPSDTVAPPRMPVGGNAPPGAERDALVAHLRRLEDGAEVGQDHDWAPRMPPDAYGPLPDGRAGDHQHAAFGPRDRRPDENPVRTEGDYGAMPGPAATDGYERPAGRPVYERPAARPQYDVPAGHAYDNLYLSPAPAPVYDVPVGHHYDVPDAHAYDHVYLSPAPAPTYDVPQVYDHVYLSPAPPPAYDVPDGPADAARVDADHGAGASVRHEGPGPGEVHAAPAERHVAAHSGGER